MYHMKKESVLASPFEKTTDLEHHEEMQTVYLRYKTEHQNVQMKSRKERKEKFVYTVTK